MIFDSVWITILLIHKFKTWNSSRWNKKQTRIYFDFSITSTYEILNKKKKKNTIKITYYFIFCLDLNLGR